MHTGLLADRGGGRGGWLQAPMSCGLAGPCQGQAEGTLSLAPHFKGPLSVLLYTALPVGPLLLRTPEFCALLKA